jgi:quercetin 2,3-dioxygenase
MSGPVRTEDTAPDPESTRGPDSTPPPVLEVTDSHTARVGAAEVRRALPRRARRTVGPWCFADHMGPIEVAPGKGIDVAPHPHTALHTVTWLLDGEILHRDSLGSEQPIRPGQLNLMTAGRGVSHSEEGTGYRGRLEGTQLWVAQPAATRDDVPGFEHHATLPRLGLGGSSTATVLLGAMGDTASPARTDWPTVGAELDLANGQVNVPLEPAFEHALVVLRGVVSIGASSPSGEAAPTTVSPGRLVYLGGGRTEVALTPGDDGAVALVFGGQPWPEPLVMWWNYVGPDHETVTRAHLDWEAGHARFGRVDSTLPRLSSPPPPWAEVS